MSGASRVRTGDLWLAKKASRGLNAAETAAFSGFSADFRRFDPVSPPPFAAFRDTFATQSVLHIIPMLLPQGLEAGMVAEGVPDGVDFEDGDRELGKLVSTHHPHLDQTLCLVYGGASAQRRKGIEVLPWSSLPTLNW